MDKVPNNIPESNNEKIPIKDGVDFVFEQNPELASTGTKEQYLEYLDTIFPESVVRSKLFQHQTMHDFEKFSNERTSSGRLREGHYFSDFGNNFIDDRFGSIKKAIVLNIKTPNYIEGGKFMKTVYSMMDDRGLNSDDELVRNEIQKEYTTNLKQSYDALIGDKNGRLNAEVLVFDSSQIHILGSKDDIEKFKSFIKSKK